MNVYVYIYMRVTHSLHISLLQRISNIFIIYILKNVKNMDEQYIIYIYIPLLIDEEKIINTFILCIVLYQIEYSSTVLYSNYDVTILLL